MNQHDFKTSDMWLAAALMALGEQMVRVERDGGPRASFVFTYTGSIEASAENYRAGKLLLEPQKLFVQTKLLKNHLYS